MSDENDYDLEDDLDENGIPYGPDNPKEEEDEPIGTEEEENIEYPVDPSNLHHRELVEEHHRKVSEEVSGDWRENLETEKAEIGETEETESDTLTDEEKAKEDYPDMAKDGMPYRQDFTHKGEPDEELKKMYPDMNVDDL